jgi:2-polyprenyl-3-methyl-5-hydroxy-6-metoxy-1,4-benzoquinol methylase
MTASYTYSDAAPTYANAYLWPHLKRIATTRTWTDNRAFDLGCGNGATCHMLSPLGFTVTGVDVSASGVAQANATYPGVACEVASAYDPSAERYGRFPLVVSLEVIEHCMEPRSFARTFYDLIEPGGLGFLSTPYHGYLNGAGAVACPFHGSHHQQAVSSQLNWHTCKCVATS